MVLLNILLEETKGMELARKIRTADDEIGIVLMASTMEYALQGYEVQALQYLVKPVGIATMKTILDYDYGRRQLRQYLSVNQRGVWRQIPLDPIICLETQGRKVAICLPNEQLYASARLSELEEQLPKSRFIRCHQSYLLNIQHIREIRRNEALTTGGLLIPISRPHLQRVQRAFLRNGYPVCSG
jgi:DNA-binding LytR/AlgR family response regulator